ncbi:hypothetical protein GCK72_015878 [Caenorhabditis remanei]|uniref:Homeobox domain-containing protein n=1 Tax=Caenorhabditis remanei TaxID=31234 RepID=A0A6A5GXL5_CAERE|nr:hypothetical protein GCK72_015878 [Caenorhabditis remanei]KAF1759411.1 hypothetical protein GCK72_015878 [Caenorhabditis remanei]
MNISLQQHDVLTKFYEKNPVPDRQQRESIAESYKMSNVEVESWFSKCQVVCPEELGKEILLEIAKLEEEMASHEPFTAHKHKTLTKFYEKNPVPDRQQRESIAKSYGMSNVEVESWFSKCRVVGPEKLGQEILLEMIKLEEEMESNEGYPMFTAHKHKTLTKFYETNPTPDYDQREIIRKSVEMTNVEVDLWFFMCRKMGPDAVWQEFEKEAEIEKEKDQKEQLETMLQSKKKLEEQEENGKKENEKLNKIIAQQAEELKESKNLIAEKNAEIQNLIKNSVKDQVNGQHDQAANLTTMAIIQQSIPARLLNVEKELARVSLQQKAFGEAELKKENERLKEQKKELEAMLQSKKKLEQKLENAKKENEVLSKNNAQQAAELTESKNLIAEKNAEIQNLIKNSAKYDQAEEKIASQAAEIQQLKSWITNLTTMSHVQSDPVRLLNMENEMARVSLQLNAFEEAELKKEIQRLKEQKEQLEMMLQSKKKLEEQVKEAYKMIAELGLYLKEVNDKVETMTKRNQEQSVELEEQVKNGKKEKKLSKIIAQQAAGLKNSVKDTVNALQEQLAKLVNEITL